MIKTIDELIAALQAQKASGVPGDTPVAIPAQDNNGKHGMAKLDVQPRLAAISKDEYGKGWGLCRLVSRSGIPIVMLG
jgi:hypothetical protein